MRAAHTSEFRGMGMLPHGPRIGLNVTAANDRSVWCAPPTGWVTVLAGLLARGSSSCVRPSRFPSGHLGRGLTAHSYGGSCGIDSCLTAFPLASPASTGEPARGGESLPKLGRRQERQRPGSRGARRHPCAPSASARPHREAPQVTPGTQHVHGRGGAGVSCRPTWPIARPCGVLGMSGFVRRGRPCGLGAGWKTGLAPLPRALMLATPQLRRAPRGERESSAPG